MGNVSPSLTGGFGPITPNTPPTDLAKRDCALILGSACVAGSSMNFSVPFPALGLPTRALTAGDVRSAAETGRNAPASVGTPVLCPSATLSSPSFGAAVETPRIATSISTRVSYAPRAGVASPPFGAIRAHALPGASQTAMSSSHAASNPVKLLSACFFFIQTLPFFLLLAMFLP